MLAPVASNHHHRGRDRAGRAQGLHSQNQVCVTASLLLFNFIAPVLVMIYVFRTFCIVFVTIKQAATNYSYLLSFKIINKNNLNRTLHMIHTTPHNTINRPRHKSVSRHLCQYKHSSSSTDSDCGESEYICLWPAKGY